MSQQLSSTASTMLLFVDLEEQPSPAFHLEVEPHHPVNAVHLQNAHPQCKKKQDFSFITLFNQSFCVYNESTIQEINSGLIIPIGWTVREGRFDTAVCLLRNIVSSTTSPVSSSQRLSKWSSLMMLVLCLNSLTSPFLKLGISYSDQENKFTKIKKKF